MNFSLLIFFLIPFSFGMNAQKMQTVFEKSQGLQTATYEKNTFVIRYSGL